jgi:hypothetical protein
MRPARVVVPGIDGEVGRQGREAMVQRLVQGFRAAVLEVRAARAADQQRVAGEERVADAQADGVVGVSGTREDLDLAAPEGDTIAGAQPPRRDVGLRLGRHEHVGAGPRSQLAGAGQVVGMRVRLDHEAQAQPALFEIGEVFGDPIDARIDEGRFARVHIGKEIREAVLRLHLVNAWGRHLNRHDGPGRRTA